MPSTKFNPAGKSNKTPAVCKKGMFALPIIYVAGLPTSLTVFALATETSGYQRIAESFRLMWDDVNKEWSGASSNNGLNLKVFIDAQPAENTYDLTLQVRQGTAVLDSHTWADEEIDPGPPFDSGLLMGLPGPGLQQFEIHAVN